MKKNKISKDWINRQHRDIYVKKSKQEGFRSRAVYKLQEINDKYKILKNGFSVIDLGAAPGGWTQFVIQKYKNSIIDSFRNNGFTLIKAPLIEFSKNLDNNTVNKKELYISNFIAKKLKKNNIFFAGIDLISNYLIGDINVTSPTGLPQYKNLTGINLAKNYWDEVKKLK